MLIFFRYHAYRNYRQTLSARLICSTELRRSSSCCSRRQIIHRTCSKSCLEEVAVADRPANYFPFAPRLARRNGALRTVGKFRFRMIPSFASLRGVPSPSGDSARTRGRRREDCDKAETYRTDAANVLACSLRTGENGWRRFAAAAHDTPITRSRARHPRRETGNCGFEATCLCSDIVRCMRSRIRNDIA